MSKQRLTTRHHRLADDIAVPTVHDLIVVIEQLPGTAPSDYDIDLSDGETYQSRFYRCRRCGQERNCRSEFSSDCSGDDDTDTESLNDWGYSVEDPRTRRALTEDIDVHVGEIGPVYEVHSQSDNTYETDIEAETCTCPDHQRSGTFCKHLRRVDIEIRTGTVPQPDGQFIR